MTVVVGATCKHLCVVFEHFTEDVSDAYSSVFLSSSVLWLLGHWLDVIKTFLKLI